MKTSHEAQVEIRELLPIILDLNKKLNNLFCQTVGLRGPQGITIPESDVSYAYQYLDGAKCLLKAIADHFGLPMPARTDAKALAVAKAWRRYMEIDRRLAEDRKASKSQPPGRTHEEREQDARDVKPACEAYKRELENLAEWVM